MAPNLKALQIFIEENAPEEEIGLFQNFASVLFDSANREFLEPFDVGQLSGFVASAVRFLNRRSPGKPLIRVYNPDRLKDGWSSDHTAIEISLEDRPFIVDSLRALLKRRNIALRHLLHPILSVERDSGGMILEIFSGLNENAPSEAYELFLVERIDDSSGLRELEIDVGHILKMVVVTTDDHLAMRERCCQVRDWFSTLENQAGKPRVPELQPVIAEYEQFLDWLADGNFIFLGYREYSIRSDQGTKKAQVVRDSGLGILRDSKKSRYFEPVPVTDLPRHIQRQLEGAPMLLVTKANAESPVHRRGRMDYIGIKECDDDSQVIGEKRFLGLFTTKAFSKPVDEIPILRRKLRKVLELDRSKEGSHDFKQIVSIFNSIPLGELFWLDIEELHRDIRAMMSVEKEQGVQVKFRRDPLHRGYSAMVIMPRERFNAKVRQEIQDYLAQQLLATHVDYNLAMTGDDETQVRFHFFFSTALEERDVDFLQLEREVSELSRSWDDRLEEALVAIEGSLGSKLAARYSTIFTEGYKAEVPVSNAVRDVHNFEELRDVPFLVDLINPEKTRYVEKTTHLRIYHPGTVALNEIFPVLENLGLKVFEQISYQLGSSRETVASDTLSVDIFRVQNSGGEQIDIDDEGRRLKEALVAILTGRVTNDQLNRLITMARLEAREVALLRTYRGYVFQLLPTTSLTFLTRTLLSNPECTETLFHYFKARFDPGLESERTECVASQEELFFETLDAVTSLPEDELLRFIFNVIKATVRTNFFLNRDYFSIKVESQKLEKIVEPRPFFEIFVSSPQMEGIHLRGGKIARGGLRWSDRPDDFRTEVLGLMKTQMTKNSLIVPTGSKGGFVLKNAPVDLSLKDHVKDQYRTLIRGMLDLTDNIVEGRTLHPASLVVYDAQDPYLVVAADKGTATFSDLANSISEEYDFWLGDAFASGGSYGYDHKKEGITARGAWECVKRHFRELGIDPMADEFSAIGIGDMSGDVFGNGMLYTDKIRLLGAFNHRHIFIDPNPDAGESFKERERLFHDPGLSWADYSKDRISKGGGVFDRHAKVINLTPEVKTLLGVTEDAMSGQAIIRHMLKVPVHLFWSGGIGTYVRSSLERDSEVGDPNNDMLRINATELKARVVGEGGNLALTQLARIEYALQGGLINTDAVDNSGGVDMSDHEVNIKVLLQPRLKKGDLSFEERNELLKSMTGQVSAHVLRNNYTQSLCLSLACLDESAGIETFYSLQRYLSTEGRLKPSVEYLPDESMLRTRKQDGQGYTRPEVAILLAYAKMDIKAAILKSSLPDETIIEDYLISYFPEALQSRFGEEIESHPLRREIIATQLTNFIVDRLGVGFLHRILATTRSEMEEVVFAVTAVHEILELKQLYESLFGLDSSVEIQSQYRAIFEVIRTLESVVTWLLLSKTTDQDLSTLVGRYRDPLRKLLKKMPGYLPPAERRRFESRRDRFLKEGFPSEISGRLALAEYLASAFGVIEASRRGEVSLEVAARRFFQIGGFFSLGWLRDQLSKNSREGHWDAIALSGLIADLRFVQNELSIELLRRGDESTSTRKLLGEGIPKIERLERTLSELRREKEVTLSAGSVVTRLFLQLLEDLRGSSSSK